MRLLQPILILFLSILSLRFYSQDALASQTIRGIVEETETHFPIPGAVVSVYRDTVFIAAKASDPQGHFRIEQVPVGRVRIVIAMTGYSTRILDDVMISSGKETVLQIELEQQIVEMAEVEIRATREGESQNEMAVVSSRQFSVNETNRYAGSRGDPARMASNFAGVQGADDSRNDIVIRGNSPQGVLWRLEGVDIPNPNHFNIPGTTGGPVSIINNKYLANSDFYTGAFPADYGNCISGVFDLRLRNGNNSKHEFTGQFGFLGTELMAEGPINREHGSSYLVGYRYSTVSLFSKLGIDIGTDAVPRYQDGNFRLFFPGKKNSTLSVWGIGGMSKVDILISDQKSPDQRNIYGQNDRDQYFGSGMAVGGVTWSKTISDRSFLKITTAAMTDVVDSYHELVYRHLDADSTYQVDSLKPLLDYNFKQNKYSAALVFNHKINKNHLLRFGFNADYFTWILNDSVRSSPDDTLALYNHWTVRWQTNTSAALIQPYVQWRYRITELLSLTMGIHGTHFTLSNSTAFAEPRAAIKWQYNEKQHIALAAGMHSGTQPFYMYFYRVALSDSIGGPRKTLNQKMDFTRSNHFVLSHQWILHSGIRILSEIYYQQLSHIPVEKKSSSFSLSNTGSGFSRFFPGELQNTGKGENYGAEITVEKFYSKGWLFLLTGSVFQAQYAGSDGVIRNTDFNGGYAFNALASKEFGLRKGGAFVVGSKVTTVGGRWYGPADIAASNTARELVFVDSLRNTLQFEPYFRLDVKMNLRFNRKKTTHEIGLDLVNLLNTQNVLSLTYAPDESGDPSAAVRKEYQLGLLPVFFYRIDF